MMLLAIIGVRNIDNYMCSSMLRLKDWLWSSVVNYFYINASAGRFDRT